jgi:hypothetical protein
MKQVLKNTWDFGLSPNIKKNRKTQNEFNDGKGFIGGILDKRPLLFGY